MLIFDFDGVLHDSRERAWRAYQTARSEMELWDLPDLAGPDELPQIYQGVLSQSLTRWIPYEAAELFWQRHAGLTDLTADEDGHGVMPDLVGVLGDLAGRAGYGIVTGSHGTTVERLLRRNLDEDAMPRVLLSRDEAGSKALKLQLMHRQYGATAYIGDTGSDIRHAHAADLEAVAVSYGYADVDDLTAAGPDLVLHTAAELASWCRVWHRGGHRNGLRRHDPDEPGPRPAIGGRA
ncbi:HAD family hydrolase [Streptomyces sp. NRRL B-24572]|uniref:HAD family hydrolase n=1 Tax=Streptomyces sp. NRRL B-24572 TaxID=1962156 RepID=UPI0015C4EFDD|nr:HAD hydrolase-like protein [Streptomyces sp. NRRL B-24572]